MKWVWLAITAVSFALLCAASLVDNTGMAMAFLIIEWVGVLMYVVERDVKRGVKRDG